MKVPLPLSVVTCSCYSALAYGSGGIETPSLPYLCLPDLPQGSRRLYLCDILARDKYGDIYEPWNVADCLSHIPLDVVASSHLDDVEETADAIYRSASSSSSTRTPPLRIVSPRLSTSDWYLTGLKQILRDFDEAYHVCIVQNEALLQATTLWQELCVLHGAESMGNKSNDGVGCRIHVLDHHSCDTTGDKWTLQMINFRCAHNAWQ